jgi:hypothetical protein
MSNDFTHVVDNGYKGEPAIHISKMENKKRKIETRGKYTREWRGRNMPLCYGIRNVRWL